MIALSIADISMKERSTIECFFIAQFSLIVVKLAVIKLIVVMLKG